MEIMQPVEAIKRHEQKEPDITYPRGKKESSTKGAKQVQRSSGSDKGGVHDRSRA